MSDIAMVTPRSRSSRRTTSQSSFASPSALIRSMSSGPTSTPNLAAVRRMAVRYEPDTSASTPSRSNRTPSGRMVARMAESRRVASPWPAGMVIRTRSAIDPCSNRRTAMPVAARPSASHDVRAAASAVESPTSTKFARPSTHERPRSVTVEAICIRLTEIARTRSKTTSSAVGSDSAASAMASDGRAIGNGPPASRSRRANAGSASAQPTRRPASPHALLRVRTITVRGRRRPCSRISSKATRSSAANSA